uniref:Uncharacterized protein n=1 Tax=Zea mays TaxID=4577 RepID=B4FEP7_MAIZE|nr:unknown [Zea mays]
MLLLLKCLQIALLCC